MTGLVFGLEWRLALARRRLFVLNALVPLAVVAPIALSRAPAAHAAAVYSVLFVLFGTFGAAIPLVRDSERGMMARISRTRISPAGYLLERAAAGALVDTSQLLPALLVVVASGTGSVTVASMATVVLAATLLVTNLLGTWVAAMARSLGEGALFSAVTGLLLLHASGVFRSPAPGSTAALIESWSPFQALHEVLLETGGAPPSHHELGLAGWALGLAAVTALCGGRMSARLAHPTGDGRA